MCFEKNCIFANYKYCLAVFAQHSKHKFNPQKLLAMADVKLNNIERKETELREKTITVTEPKACGCVCVGPEDKIDAIAKSTGKTVSNEGSGKPIE